LPSSFADIVGEGAIGNWGLDYTSFLPDIAIATLLLAKEPETSPSCCGSWRLRSNCDTQTLCKDSGDSASSAVRSVLLRNTPVVSKISEAIMMKKIYPRVSPVNRRQSNPQIAFEP